MIILVDVLFHLVFNFDGIDTCKIKVYIIIEHLQIIHQVLVCDVLVSPVVRNPVIDVPHIPCVSVSMSILIYTKAVVTFLGGWLLVSRNLLMLIRHLMVLVEIIILFEIVMEFIFDDNIRTMIKFSQLLISKIFNNLLLNILFIDLNVLFNL
jgi:hypothetical protein